MAAPVPLPRPQLSEHDQELDDIRKKMDIMKKRKIHILEKARSELLKQRKEHIKVCKRKIDEIDKQVDGYDKELGNKRQRMDMFPERRICVPSRQRPPSLVEQQLSVIEEIMKRDKNYRLLMSKKWSINEFFKPVKHMKPQHCFYFSTIRFLQSTIFKNIQNQCIHGIEPKPINIDDSDHQIRIQYWKNKLLPLAIDCYDFLKTPTENNIITYWKDMTTCYCGSLLYKIYRNWLGTSYQKKRNYSSTNLQVDENVGSKFPGCPDLSILSKHGIITRKYSKPSSAGPSSAGVSSNKHVKVRFTKQASSLAIKHKINLSYVKGTGLYGRVKKSDVKRVIIQKHSKPSSAGASSAGPSSAEVSNVVVVNTGFPSSSECNYNDIEINSENINKYRKLCKLLKDKYFSINKDSNKTRIQKIFLRKEVAKNHDILLNKIIDFSKSAISK